MRAMRSSSSPQIICHTLSAFMGVFTQRQQLAGSSVNLPLRPRPWRQPARISPGFEPYFSPFLAVFLSPICSGGMLPYPNCISATACDCFFVLCHLRHLFCDWVHWYLFLIPGQLKYFVVVVDHCDAMQLLLKDRVK